MQADEPKTTNTDSLTTEPLIGGGFRIDPQQDDLSVTRYISSANKRNSVIAVIIGVCFVSLLYVSEGKDPLALIVSILFLAVSLLIQYLLVATHNLRCTRETLEVIDVVRGRIKRVRSYPRTDVREIKFGPVSFSRYGAICGLIFVAAGKKMKVLYGLQCIEAQKILKELDRLGYDVVHDVGMPMMVEMAEERRKAWYGAFFG